MWCPVRPSWITSRHQRTMVNASAEHGEQHDPDPARDLVHVHEAADDQDQRRDAADDRPGARVDQMVGVVHLVMPVMGLGARFSLCRHPALSSRLLRRPARLTKPAAPRSGSSAGRVLEQEEGVRQGDRADVPRVRVAQDRRDRRRTTPACRPLRPAAGPARRSRSTRSCRSSGPALNGVTL